MKIKLSATYEGRCMLCGKDTVVFTAGDEETKKAVTICKECSEKLGDISVEETIEKHGKVDEAAFKEGMRIEKGNRSLEPS